MSVINYLYLTLTTLYCNYHPMTMILLICNLLEQGSEAIQLCDKILDVVRCPLDCNPEVIQLDETDDKLPRNLDNCNACVYFRQ